MCFREEFEYVEDDGVLSNCDFLNQFYVVVVGIWDFEEFKLIQFFGEVKDK